MYELCHRSWKYHRLYSAVLGYVSMSEEANIKLVELVGKHSILYDWKDTGFTRKEKNDLEWENIKQGLNKIK
jgi:hypothetical protein